MIGSGFIQALYNLIICSSLYLKCAQMLELYVEPIKLVIDCEKLQYLHTFVGPRRGTASNSCSVAKQIFLMDRKYVSKFMASAELIIGMHVRNAIAY